MLQRLIATADVIVENYTPRVLDQAGLSFEALRAIRHDIILIRMPGFGLDGPWRDNAAFAYTIEDASGLTWMTGHRRPETARALLHRRPERRDPRPGRPAAGAGAPPPHR